MVDAVRIRKDVWKLADWDPILLWYAKGIQVMQGRAVTDPTSWRYQAAIHDYDPSADPLAQPGETLPSADELGQFWAQCQHGSWYFLPWHRMFLLYFEQIVAAAVVAAGGPADWALPYWNYSDPSNVNARRLPPAFRAATLPDGSANPLLIQARRTGADAGRLVASTLDVDLSSCLNAAAFAGQMTGGDSGFGGPPTEFSHGGGTVGLLEATPHGSMHVAVGGPTGWMSAFNTAGLDPIFWLHHANIDRLWEVWLQRNLAHQNPTLAKWLAASAFEFHDATGAVVSLQPGQVLSTTAAPLFYSYEDTSEPLGPRPAAAMRTGMAVMNEQPIPEMVGATEQPVTLAGQAVATTLAVGAPTGPARLARLAAGVAPRIYLNFENITGEGAPVSYAVYLNLPAGTAAEQHPELFAGILPMFGVAEASRSRGAHAGSGLHYALDVTDVVGRLQASNAWDPGRLSVTFVPNRNEEEAADAAPPAGAAPIQVGRISVYHA